MCRKILFLSKAKFMFLLILIKLIEVYGILGGKAVNISDAPFQVNYADRCGAVLVHRKWALTTAHCGPEGTYIRIGSSHRLKGAKTQINSHFIHPKYKNEHDFDYDVQLLRLYRGLHFGSLVGGVKICSGNCGGELRVFGWGYSKENGEYNDVLQAIQIEIVPLEECQEVKLSWYNHTITSRMFCAGGLGPDACQGDSGGAAVSSGQLVGMSSFGYGCGRKVPGVYTNISQEEIRGFITRHTGI